MDVYRVNGHVTRPLRVAYFRTEVWCRSDEPKRLWFSTAPGTRERPEDRSRKGEQLQEQPGRWGHCFLLQPRERTLSKRVQPRLGRRRRAARGEGRPGPLPGLSAPVGRGRRRSGARGAPEDVNTGCGRKSLLPPSTLEHSCSACASRSAPEVTSSCGAWSALLGSGHGCISPTRLITLETTSQTRASTTTDAHT